MIYEHSLDPILFSLGPLRVGWYGLMYVVSFFTGYWYYLRESRRGNAPMQPDDVSSMLVYGIVGVIVGGRLGWVIFYGGLPYFVEPWRILETWKGGMSFHGGLLGVILAMWLFSRRHRIHPVDLSDFVLVWVPVGLFLGRIGNFINGELYGKPTDGTWGVVFPGDPLGLPRHPTQLYEAFLEGIVLFGVLWVMRGRVRRQGHQSAVFLLLYGVFRFAVEFIRLPDADIGYLWHFLTMGQLLSVPMIAVGLAWALYLILRPPPESERQAAA